MKEAVTARSRSVDLTTRDVDLRHQAETRQQHDAAMISPRASVLATVLSDDAANVFVTLTAREMNPDLTIIARGEQPQTERKLRTCGANTVVMTTTIGAERISRLILRPTADELLDRVTAGRDVGMGLEQLGLAFDELAIGPSSPFCT